MKLELNQIIDEMQDLLDSGDPAKFRYIQEWKEQLEELIAPNFKLFLTGDVNGEPDKFVGTFVTENDAWWCGYNLLLKDGNSYLGFLIDEPQKVVDKK